MTASVKQVSCPQMVVGFAARPPRGGAGGAPQLLALFHDHIQEVKIIPDVTGAGIAMGPRLHLAGERLDCAALITFDEFTDSVFFFNNGSEKLMQLGRDDVVTAVAGGSGDSHGGCSDRVARDGRGAAARFGWARALVSDGRGRLYVADKSTIRRVDIATGDVTTLWGSELPSDAMWDALAYDTAAGNGGGGGRLLAATSQAIYQVHLPPTPAAGGDSASGGGGCAAVAALQLLAGRPLRECSVDGLDGRRRDARFVSICRLALDGGGGGGSGGSGGAGLYISERGGVLRYMAPSGDVETLLSGELPAACSGLVMLPSGDLLAGGVEYRYKYGYEGCLALVHLSGFARRALRALGGAAAQPPAGDGASGGGMLYDIIATPADCSISGALGAVVTIWVDDEAFVVHRALLAARSEYFQRWLAPDGGFADSGGGGGGGGRSAGQLSLPYADPRAFGWLISWMYDSRTEVPDELLRPAAALAERLLLPAGFRSRLQARLLEGVTTASVVSELDWAHHNLPYMVPELKEFIVQHRGAVPKGALGELVARCPELAEVTAALVG